MPKNTVIKQIPNLITSANLFFGCLSITFAFEQNLQLAGYMILIAAALDFMDGFFARILHAYSEFGKSLDSLADAVSFGVAPAVIMYQMLIMSLTFHDASFNIETAGVSEKIILYSAFLVAVFAAIRLARFNVTASDKTYFIGLPTPASAIFVASLALILVGSDKNTLYTYLLNTYLLVILVFLLSVLMVSGIRLFSLKFSSYGFKENKTRYSFLAISLVLLILLQISAIPIILFLYIFLSLLQNWNILPE